MEPAMSAVPAAGRESTPDVLPASQYLQERLQERRARNIRPKRLRQSDFGPRRGRDDDIFVTEAEESSHAANRLFDSSPLAAGLSRNATDAGDGSKRRVLGAKGVDEHMDRLTKENFALKLELDHRRAYTAKLQEQIEGMRADIERAEQVHEEHAELLRINSQLVEELEKRDKAVEEAMDIICELEDRVADMEDRSTTTRPSTANADSGYAGTETHEHAPPSSPPDLSKPPKTPQIKQDSSPIAASAATNRLLNAVNAVNGKTPARLRREPLALTEKKQSTQALRSVFLEATQSLHPVKSFNSLLTRQESRQEEDDETPNSPRLSVLSESSFPSLYSPKKVQSPDRFNWESAEHEDLLAMTHGPSPHMRQDSIKRVSQWMDQRVLIDETPSKSNSITAPLSQQEGNVNLLSPSKGPARGEKRRQHSDSMARGAEDDMSATDAVQYIKPFPIRTGRGNNKSSRPTSFGGAMFGEPLLPPTPDSASTRMLRASRSSIVDERSLLDTTPVTVKGYDALEPGIRTAPRQMRSSVELKNAYQSYIQHNDEYAIVQDDDDAASDAVRDLGLDYDGFPDGASILTGTPSRFRKHPKSPLHPAPADGYEVTPALPGYPPFARQQSSPEATRLSPQKPHLGRSETSPPMPYGYSKLTTAGLQSSNGSITSPRSYYSGSSSNRTIVQPEDRARTISPELHRMDPSAITSPPRSRASPSPARRLSQKAGGILRRLSNTQRELGIDREKSPLPTLTSAPSSAFVNHVPKEARRPGTSYSGGDASSSQSMYAGVRTAEFYRPVIPPRTNTAPNAPPRPMSASIPEPTAPPHMDTERKSLFRTKKGLESAGQDNNSPAQEGGGVLGMITRRRDSIKDAVSSATRRPWR